MTSTKGQFKNKKANVKAFHFKKGEQHKLREP